MNEVVGCGVGCMCDEHACSMESKLRRSGCIIFNFGHHGRIFAVMLSNHKLFVFI